MKTEADLGKNIIWLASYPKSGNTWFRMFLSALFSGTEIDINNLITDGIFSGKKIIEEVLDIDTDECSTRQIAPLQKFAFSYHAMSSPRKIYLKIHDAFLLDNNGCPFIPVDATFKAIYFVRNPLDIALSMANHIGKDVDEAINKYLTNPNAGLNPQKNTSDSQFYQPIGTWNSHVESWLTRPGFPVHYVRYEDLSSNPFEIFKEAIQAIGLEVTDEQIHNAIAATRFEKLQKQEKEKVFKETNRPDATFFFKGQAGRWKEELTNEQVQKIRAVNEPMMRHFGYW